MLCFGLMIILEVGNSLLSSMVCSLVHTDCELKYLRDQFSVPFFFLIYVNTFHAHIHSDTKITCYADDIALWHTHRDINVSEEAIDKTWKGIAAWAKYLKLTINADKTRYYIFSTDRRHRVSFNANIKKEDFKIKRVIFPAYLGITLDSELCFLRHIEQTSNKALGKLNLLRNSAELHGDQDLKNVCYSMIRPVLEYAP